MVSQTPPQIHSKAGKIGKRPNAILGSSQKPGMLDQGVAVSHSGNKIGDLARPASLVGC